MNIKQLKSDKQFIKLVKSIADYWDGGLNLNLKFASKKLQSDKDVIKTAKSKK